MNREKSVLPEQKTALCVLFDESPHVLEARTYVQKLMFLFQKEADADWFHFEPWDYGPFSRELYDVLENCVEEGYVVERIVEVDDGMVRYHYEAGPAIDEQLGNADDDLREPAIAVFEEWPTNDLPDLVDSVYVEFPKWARNSRY